MFFPILRKTYVAEGHHLDIVAGMKGYTAIIVDITGFLGLNKKTSPEVDLS